MADRTDPEGLQPRPWTSVTDALGTGSFMDDLDAELSESFADDLDAALAAGYDPGTEALHAVETELDRARETVAELAERLEGETAEWLRPQLAAAHSGLGQYVAAVEKYAANLRAATEWTVPGLPMAPVALGPEVVADAAEAADSLADDVDRARGLLHLAAVTPADTPEDSSTSPARSLFPAEAIARKELAGRLRSVRRWERNLRRHLRRCSTEPQDSRPPGRGCSTPRRPVHRCRPRGLTPSGSTDDPAPRRRQGAPAGTPTSPGRDDRERGRAPTDP